MVSYGDIDDLHSPLRKTTGLRVISLKHRKLGAAPQESSLPNFTNKLKVAVADNLAWETPVEQLGSPKNKLSPVLCNICNSDGKKNGIGSRWLLYYISFMLARKGNGMGYRPTYAFTSATATTRHLAQINRGSEHPSSRSMTQL